MTSEKKMTGYPSIDRPQEKFYRTKPVRELETEQTIYELIFNSNKENICRFNKYQQMLLKEIEKYY